MVLVCLAGSVAMMTVGWYCQLVHYPSFLFIAQDRFAEFHAKHTSMTGIVVVPAMMAELLASVWIVGERPAGMSAPWALTGLGLAILAWAGTFLMAVPLHQKLSTDGWDESTIRALVASNLPRTLAWTAHAAWCIATLWPRAKG